MNYKIITICSTLFISLLETIISPSVPNVINFEFKQSVDNSQRDQAFGYFDNGRDIGLDESEFRSLLKSLFVSNKPNKADLIDESLVKRLFKLLDLNGDHWIDKQEFDIIWKDWISVILKPKSALIVVDMQNDFLLESGSLYMRDAIKLIPEINKLISTVNFDAVVYTHDWHPSNHCSFVDNVKLRQLIEYNGVVLNGSTERREYDKIVENVEMGDSVKFASHPNVTQQLWPKHCVQNSEGAKLHRDLIEVTNRVDIYKGLDPDIDSYSAFADNGHTRQTELDRTLRSKNISDVYVCGVAFEYCVGSTANDSIRLGYRTALIENISSGVSPLGIESMRNTLTSRSAIVTSREVADMVSGEDRRVEMAIELAEILFNERKSDSYRLNEV